MQKTLLLIIILLVSLTSFAQRSDFWNINFSKADSIADLYANANLEHTDKLAEALTKDLTTDIEKFRAIFRWVANNIRYDCDLYRETKSKEKELVYKRKELAAWHEKLAKKTLTRTINKKLALCAGYSMLLEIMCRHVGIQCVVIEGYSRNIDNKIGKRESSHAWNAVSINNKWYLSDPTWASGYVDEPVKNFFKKFNKNYFLTDPTLLIANHFPSDSSWTLLINKPSLREFLNAPIKTNGYLTNKINHYAPVDGIIKSKLYQQVDFKFTSNHDKIIEEAHLSIQRLKETTEVNRPLVRNKEGEYIIEHFFLEKGTFIVEIYINNELTFIYNVIVS